MDKHIHKKWNISLKEQDHLNEKQILVFEGIMEKIDAFHMKQTGFEDIVVLRFSYDLKFS